MVEESQLISNERRILTNLPPIREILGVNSTITFVVKMVDGCN
jgi:hypothetical protein